MRPSARWLGPLAVVAAGLLAIAAITVATSPASAPVPTTPATGAPTDLPAPTAAPSATRARTDGQGALAARAVGSALEPPRLARPTPTARPALPTAPAPRPSATVTALASPTRAADGRVEAPPPYFRFRRPFDPPLDDRPSRYYPYGTTANRQYLLHHGVDIGNPLGSIVLAVGDGTVVYAGPDDVVAWGPSHDFYGNLVVVEHHGGQATDPDLFSLYGHLSRTLVEAGQAVRAGEPIAEVGATGIALGPHLHLELRSAARDYEATYNPELFLVPSAGCGVIVGRLLDAEGAPAPEQDIGLYRLQVDGTQAWIASTRTYPADHVNPSPLFGENFLFGDVAAGTYRVVAAGGASAELAIGALEVWLVTLAPEP